MQRFFTVLALAAAALLTACRAEPSVATTPVPATPARPAPSVSASIATPPRPAGTVTILYTTDEHGWLFGHGAGEKKLGGAAEALALFRTNERLCIPQKSSSEGAADSCATSATLLLSGGDNFTGPAVSSYFQGLPMAEAMAQMGYVASAFGNHELDFDRPAFDANRAASGITYLAANATLAPGASDLKLRPWIMVERAGFRIGIVGVATEGTTKAALPSRFEGTTFEPLEAALDRSVAEVYKQGADVVGIIAHACEDEMAPIVERHPEWHAAFVGLGHCHRRLRKEAFGTVLVMPSWRLDAYARVQIAVDPSRPVRERVTSVAAELVEVRLGETLSPDGGIEAIRTAARTKLDAALGATIGFSVSGADDDSEVMGRWITRALREEMKTDLAVVNWSSFRESLGKGAITKEAVHNILPFDNDVVVVRVTGAVVSKMLKERAFVVAGAKRVAVTTKPFKQGKPVLEGQMDGGAAIDANKIYTVAMTDFLYAVGKDFDFKTADPKPNMTGLDWRTPIIAWTTKQKTTEKAPLETKIGGSTKPPPKKKKAAKEAVSHE